MPRPRFSDHSTESFENAAVKTSSSPSPSRSATLTNWAPGAPTAAFSNDSVLWSENLGRGKFGEPQLISDRTNGTESVVGADFDGDGDIDVASASYFDNKIAWYENLDGGGRFGPQRLVGRAGRAPEDLFAADLDGDDDIDLLTTSRYDNTISWYENVDALGTFGKAQADLRQSVGPVHRACG